MISPLSLRPFVLNKLTRTDRAQHWWIPSPEQIRPSDAVRAAKDEALEKISREYSSPTDFVLIQVFGAPSARLEVRNGML